MQSPAWKKPVCGCQEPWEGGGCLVCWVGKRREASPPLLRDRGFRAVFEIGVIQAI